MKSIHTNAGQLAKYWPMFKGCIDFSTFQKCLRKIANECAKPNAFYLGKEKFYSYKYNGEAGAVLYSEDSFKKACGDIFEIFAEFLFNFFQSDEVFGCKEGTYESFGDEEDIGCDGKFVLKVNNANAFLQVKFRNNLKDKPFDKDVFASLYTDADLFHGFDRKNENERLIFITNLKCGKRTFLECATPIFQRCIHKMENQIILIGKNEIE